MAMGGLVGYNDGYYGEAPQTVESYTSRACTGRAYARQPVAGVPSHLARHARHHAGASRGTVRGCRAYLGCLGKLAVSSVSARHESSHVRLPESQVPRVVAADSDFPGSPPLTGNLHGCNLHQCRFHGGVDMRARPTRKSVSQAVKEAAWLKTNGKCWFCGRLIGDGVKSRNHLTPYDMDHLTPVCQGGTNDIDNIVFACARCNRSKSRRNLEEYREFLSETPPEWLRWCAWSFERWTRWPHGEFEETLIATFNRYLGHWGSVRVVFYGETLGMDLANNYVI